MAILQKGSFKEVDIENFIWDNIGNGELQKRGLQTCSDRFYRQFVVPGAGVADIVGFRIYKSIDTGERRLKVAQIEIYELKRGSIICDSVGQVVRYRQALIEQFDSIQESLGVSGYMPNIHCILIGSSIDRDAALLCYESGVVAYTFDFCWKNGLVFNEFSDTMIFDGGHEDSKLVERLSSSSFIGLARNGIKRIKEVMSKNVDIPF